MRLKFRASDAESSDMDTVGARFESRPARLRMNDQGVTLVEMMVAIIILAIVLTAVASVIISSLTAVQENEGQVRASALGNELLERMSAQPWETLGLYVSEAPAVTYGGEPVVLLPDETARDDRVPAPSESVTPGDGREYTVQRWITWVDDPLTAEDQDLRRLTVELTWEVRGQQRTMRTQTLRSANPDEAISLQVSFSDISNRGDSDSDLAGAGVVGLAPGTFTNTGSIDIEVEVNDVDASVEISFIDRNGLRRTLNPSPPGDTRLVTVGIGTYPFANGPLSFAVTATSADGTETASNTDTLTFYQPLEVQTPTLSQVGVTNPICVDGTGTPTSEVVVEVQVDGLSATAAVADKVVATWDGNGDGTDETPLPLSPVVSNTAGGRFRGVLPGPFTTESFDLTITATRNDPNPVDGPPEPFSGVDALSVPVEVSLC